MVGSWSSGNRWLMNCMVMASKQETELRTVTTEYVNYQLGTRGCTPGLGTGPSGALQTLLTKGKGYLPLFPTPPAPSITSLYSRDSAAGLLQLPPTGRAPESIVLWSSPGPLGKAA